MNTVTIGSGVTSIGYGAFANCVGLTSITLPFVGNALNNTRNTHFGYIFGASDYSFNASKVPTSLKTVVITGGTKIENIAFSGCSGLTSITIPNSVTSIGAKAFQDCSGLTSITLPFVGETLNGTANTHFGYIFGAVRSYVDNPTFVPTSLKTVVITGGTSIGRFAFYGCSGLTKVTIPASVTNIEAGAFSTCTGLTSTIIPDSVTSIGEVAFIQCNGLISATIGNSVTIT
ncbi:MAG: leucine-rich repeat domain-containing protein, partial [Clostridia bacterium]